MLLDDVKDVHDVGRKIGTGQAVGAEYHLGKKLARTKTCWRFIYAMLDYLK
jgi:hypothetical protein